MGLLTIEGPSGTIRSYSFLAPRNFTNLYTCDEASNRPRAPSQRTVRRRVSCIRYSIVTLDRLTSLTTPSAFGSGSFGFSWDGRLLAKSFGIGQGKRTMREAGV